MYTDISLILTSIAFITYIYIGLYIYIIDRKSLANKYFLIICLFFAFWSLCYIVIDVIADQSVILIWSKLKYTAMIDVAFMIYFILALTGYNNNLKFKKLIYIFIWLPALILVYQNLFHNAVVKDYPNGFWYLYLQIGLNGSYTLAMVIILLFWHFNSKSIRIKKQSFIIIAGILATVIVTFIGQLAASRDTPFINAPFAGLIWVIAFWYAMIKYKLLVLTPQMIGADILADIDEILLLANVDGEILYYNEKGKNLLNITDESMLNINNYISEYDHFSDLIRSSESDILKQKSIRLNFISNSKNKILIDTSVKTYFNKYGDRMGTLFIGREVRGLSFLKMNYKITSRELEIIQHILTGLPTNEIADITGVSINTVKSHKANIFYKLGISNKTELINMMKQFE